MTDPSPHAAPLRRALQLLASPAPLLLVATFAAILLLALQAGPFGLPLLFIAGSWFLKYAFVLLEHAAQGRSGAPVLSIEAANPFGEQRPLLFALLIAACIGLTSIVDQVAGASWGSILRIAGMLALPAIIAIHAVAGSLAVALNPSTIAAMMHRLGGGYVTVMVVAAVCGMLLHWIVAGTTANLNLLLRIALAMQLWLLLFALLGAVIHDRRLEIGFEPEYSPERAAQRQTAEIERERSRFIDQVFAEFRSGASQNAWTSIQRRAGEGPGAIAEYQWILQRVAAWPGQALTRRVAHELLGLLLAQQRIGEALQLVRAQLQADPGLRPATAEQTMQLAQLARDGGDWPLARALLNDFEARFPAHPARQRAAQLLEQLQRK